jgi:hypothetical protein
VNTWLTLGKSKKNVVVLLLEEKMLIFELIKPTAGNILNQSA